MIRRLIMLALGCDHGGYELKQEIKRYLDNHDIPYLDWERIQQYQQIILNMPKWYVRLY